MLPKSFNEYGLLPPRDYVLSLEELRKSLLVKGPTKKSSTWDPDSRKLDPDSCKKQLPMWHVYRIELYPHYDQESGIKDKHGYQLMFPSAFRQSRREYRRKGIIKIKK
jgi:hypothetical protein